MQRRDFTGSRLRRAVYDPASRQLDLHWEGGRVDAYRPVPDAVWRRLCSAPNPATYWEDRIAEEYPKVRAMAGPLPPPAPTRPGPSLQDLFGSAGPADEGGAPGPEGPVDEPGSERGRDPA
ncbi:MULTISPECIES: KTSC domain-containing protein [Ramlibacter]|uniref:KTSC domain-containing protein n=1 Tax=Ramlibacter aquaticus TaxID=2780094 RepID=A0ABR9SHE7_9BURK|nr:MULTISPECIES: KTSC domain-containing protein [Ramlibacter]MBE7941791.1 KTSC domain-containing protein [Ramlibacter aquaticus]